MAGSGTRNVFNRESVRIGRSDRPSGGDCRGIIARLNTEWVELVDRSRATARFWATECVGLEGCRDLDEVLVAVRRSPDEVLGFLIDRQCEGCQLAGRVVLQAMLGKLVTMAARDRLAAIDEATIDEYVAELWLRICSYPLARRPDKIAANLSLDTLKAVRRAKGGWQGRIALVGDQLESICAEACERGQLDHNAAVQLTAGQVINTASELGLINSSTSATLRQVYVEGLSGKAAARRLDTSPAMVRYRCSRGLRLLAAHAIDIAEAA